MFFSFVLVINSSFNLLGERGGERGSTRVAFSCGPRHWHERSCPELCVLLGETWSAVRVENSWRTRGWHQHEALWETIQRFSRCTEPPFITSAGRRWWREPRLLWPLSPVQVTSALSDTHWNFILITTKRHPNIRVVASISNLDESILAVRTPWRRNSGATDRPQ